MPELDPGRERAARRKVLVAASLASSACFRGVARFARQNGWHLVSDFMHTGAFPRGWKGDGVIALAGYQADLFRHIQTVGAPCVAISICDDAAPFPCVRGDHRAVGRMAADHLLERAYRNFAWAPFISDQVNRENFLGFEARLAEYDCACHVLSPAHRRIGSFWHDHWDDYRRALIAKLPQLPRPTAIFAANDSVAAEIVDACGELEIAVPDEIAIVGVGNDETVCEAAAVPLSSVDLDLEEMAYQAAVTLDEIMQGNSVPDVTVISPKRVITRVSTDTCAVSNSHVAKALSYIAEHYSEPLLSVADVAVAVGMSRRHLERSFRAAIGCTVYDHIIKRRMQEASRLLRSHPRAKVAAIAGLVGFEGVGNFFRTFRRFFGESPKVHRQSAVPAPAIAGASEESARVSA